jgi:eukaryotic-like serine/threonine-protein kinase
MRAGRAAAHRPTLRDQDAECQRILRGERSGVEQDTQAFEPVGPAGLPPPAGPPPRALLDDIWPWLALLGVVVVAGLLVWLFVFRGHHHKSQVVPSVVGLRQQAAIARLTGQGYSVKAIVGPAKGPRGVVSAQAPGGGSQLPKGSTVTLQVSNGRRSTLPATTTTATTTRRVTTTAPAPTAAVPAVTGQDMASGAGQVEAAGFVAETDPVQGGGTPGSIVQESPSAGTQAPAGGTVTLSVATPPSPPSTQIPDVTGKTAAEARAALLQAKLTVKTAYAQGARGVVLRESPTGTAPAYTQVTISVGK